MLGATQTRRNLRRHPKLLQVVFGRHRL
jgi:hypothetical protein